MSTRQKLEQTVYEPKEWEDVACPVCGSQKRSLHERFGDRRQYSYQLCLSCHLVYLSPRPKYDQEFVRDAYEYYADEDDRYEHTLEFLESTSADAVAESAEIRSFDPAGTALLDVGCAMGNFLLGARKNYKNVYGLEVSRRMAAFVTKTLGVEVYTTPFEDLSTDVRFSCVYMSHVIEHIPDPNAWLRKAQTLLADNGIVVLNVPNMFSLDRRVKLFLKRLGLRKGVWEAWRTPDHLYEPTLPGMRELFSRNDFEILSFYTYSRKDIVSSSWWAKWYHRGWYFGSNFRFITAPRKKNRTTV